MPALKVERAKSNVTYWVEHGKYAASSQRTIKVLEEILPRLEGKAVGAASLAQSEAYQEALPQLGGGVIQFFARIVGNLKAIAPDRNASGFKVGPVLDALRLDAIHSVCGHVNLEITKTRIQGAVLRRIQRPARSSIFGAKARHSPGFSLPLAANRSFLQRDAIRIWAALYETLKRVANAAIGTPGQQGGAAMVERPCAVAAWHDGSRHAGPAQSGEFASMQLKPYSLDPQKASLCNQHPQEA